MPRIASIVIATAAVLALALTASAQTTVTNVKRMGIKPVRQAPVQNVMGQGVEAKDACEIPLKIAVVGIGQLGRDAVAGHIVDPQAKVTLGKDIYVKLKFMGGKPPYSISWTDKVQGAVYCHVKGHPEWYYFPHDGRCDDQEQNDDRLGRFLGGDISPDMVVKAYTRNITWHERGSAGLGQEADVQPLSSGTEEGLSYKRPSVGSATSAITQTDEIMLVGKAAYDGPLPISKFETADGRDDLSRNPIELLAIRARSSCPIPRSQGEAQIASVMPTETVKFAIEYPAAGDVAFEDVDVEMKYTDVKNVYEGIEGTGVWVTDDQLGPKKIHCPPDVQSQFPDVCGKRALLLISAVGSLDIHSDDYAWGLWEGTSKTGRVKFMDIIKAITQSVAYAAYELKNCEASDQNCRHNKLTKYLDGDISDIKNIFLVWRSGAKWESTELKWNYLNFDIRSIDFETDFWEARYMDVGNKINNNVNNEKNDIMDAREYLKLDGGNTQGGIFQRKEVTPYSRP